MCDPPCASGFSLPRLISHSTHALREWEGGKQRGNWLVPLIEGILSAIRQLKEGKDERIGNNLARQRTFKAPQPRQPFLWLFRAGLNIYTLAWRYCTVLFYLFLVRRHEVVCKPALRFTKR